jgi:hypothetical protein
MGGRTAVTVDVARVPRVKLSKGSTLERIYRARDAEGRPRAPWYFSSRGEGHQGRFDLAHPAGTCYLAGDLDSAFRETFRGARVIAEDDVARRRVLTVRSTRTSAPWADLAHELASEGGVTLDAFSGSDYAETQAIAAACHDSADRGVISLIRHQSDGAGRGYSMFGAAGPSDEPPSGWIGESEPLRNRVDQLAPHLRSRIRAVPRAMRPTSL